MEADFAMAEEAARLAYGWHPELRDLKRLRTRLAELRRMAAEFRYRPSRYSTLALLYSDKEAAYCLNVEQGNEWFKFTRQRLATDWLGAAGVGGDCRRSRRTGGAGTDAGG